MNDAVLSGIPGMSGKLIACANSGYQVLFPPPLRLGSRLHQMVPFLALFLLLAYHSTLSDGRRVSFYAGKATDCLQNALLKLTCNL